MKDNFMTSRSASMKVSSRNKRRVSTAMTWCVVLPVVLVVITQRLCFAIEPQVAELSFDGSFRKNPTGTNSIPAWIQAVEQEGGEFLDHPPCWHVAESNPPGRGRLSVVIDRHLMNEDLAMSLLCDEGAGGDPV